MAQHDTESQGETSFLRLPNEVLTEIIRKLGTKDRKNLAAVNSQFRELVKMTGFRFHQVNCYVDETCFIYEYPGLFLIRFDRNTPLDKIAAVFYHATANIMFIPGEFNNQSVKMVRTVMKTLRIINLRIGIFNEIDLNLFSDLYFPNGIKTMRIELDVSGMDFHPVKPMLLSLPKLETLEINISQKNSQPRRAIDIIDDDVIAHFASISPKVIVTGVHHTAVSASGLANVVEIVGSNSGARVVDFNIAPEELVLFRSRLVHSKFETENHAKFPTERIKHRDSGVFIFPYTEESRCTIYIRRYEKYGPKFLNGKVQTKTKQ